MAISTPIDKQLAAQTRVVEGAYGEMVRTLGTRDAKKVMQRALTKAAKPVLTSIRQATPRDTGKLRRSVRSKFQPPRKATKRKAGSGLNITIGYHRLKGRTLIGALAVEFGNRTTSPARALRNAFDLHADSMVDSFARDIAAAVRDVERDIAKKLRAAPKVG